MTQCEGAYFNEWLIIDWLTKTVKRAFAATIRILQPTHRDWRLDLGD